MGHALILEKPTRSGSALCPLGPQRRDAASFMQALKGYIENPLRLLSA
jgi:hypothetical protein